MSPPYYGSKTQWETNERKKPILIPEDRKYILKVLGKFLYYARAVGRTIMIALVTLEAAKSKVTEDTKEAVDHLLYYCTKNPDSKLIFHASNTTFHLHSNASSISELHTRSCAGGHFS